MKLVGERRALAAAVLAFYAVMFLMNALLGPEPLRTPIGALAGVYGVAFFALVAGYFWARWFAMGVSLFGVIVGAVGLWQAGGIDEMTLFLGGTHLLGVLSLWGEGMAGPFDGQEAWRARFHIDDNARHRLGRAVMRAGVSLPMFVLYALMPKPGSLDAFATFHAHTCHHVLRGVNLDGIGAGAVVIGALALLPLVRFARARA